VAQVQLNRHKYTLLHHRRTRRENCTKLVSCKCTATLQKACRITESYSGRPIPRCVELCNCYVMHLCLSGISRSAMQPAT